jgi:hypothetical protein
MASFESSSRLTKLQADVLKAFFAHERAFFLTGGGALAGYHLKHRETSDLALFTLESGAFERGRYVLPVVADEVGATLEVRLDTPAFRRYALTRTDGALVVDLVHERVHQVVPDKPLLDGIRVDPPEEILANKLTALVGRQEERDLVDVYFLEERGFKVEAALDAALLKDGGCTPATLAWLLSELRIDDSAKLPGGVAPSVLRNYVGDLVRRLRWLAAPAT